MIKIRHTGLVTSDLKKSLIFWNKILKFKVKKRAIENGILIDKIMEYKSVKVETLKLSDDHGCLLELLHFKNPPSKKRNVLKPYSIGFTHISISVKDILKVYKILKKNRIKFNSEPLKSADGKVLMTYCKTPEGAYLELVQEINKNAY
tara:strand:- start:93 stop:536 length:444 start_codon:yes stop_codon:yes gene_type:complete